MFSHEAKNLYRSIHAPDSLKETIQKRMEVPEQKTGHSQYFKPLLTAAACLILVMATMLATLRTPTVELTMGGILVTKTPIAVAGSTPMTARTLPDISDAMEINLELTDAKSATISVSHGKVEYTAPTLVWQVPTDALADSTASLTLNINRTQTVYSLFCDDTGTWYLAKGK